MEYGEIVYACALNKIFNHKAIISKQLLEHFTFPSEIFSLSRNDLEREIGIPSVYCEKILDNSYLEWAEKEVEWCNQHKVRLLYLKDKDYPYRLRACADSPTILYYKGSSDLNSERVIALVGTRRAGDYSLTYCRKIIKSLSLLEPKPIIVSGLAQGIDIAAHRQALELGLETIGVMGTGIDTIYPRPHRDTAVEMLKSGGIITDLCVGFPTLPLNFIKRNRIIAGLCDATVLLESKTDGGGAITAKMAFHYDREVFALPGFINEASFEGCNELIYNQTASIIKNENSIAQSLNWQQLSQKRNSNSLIRPEDNPSKSLILKALQFGKPMDTNTLQSFTKLSISQLSLNLTELELENRIVSEYGRYRLRS